DSHPKFRLRDRSRKEKRSKNEPDRGIAEACQSRGGRKCASEYERRERCQHSCTHRDGLRHQRDDNGYEKRQQMPLARVEGGKRRNIEQNARHEHNAPAPRHGNSMLESWHENLPPTGAPFVGRSGLSSFSTRSSRSLSFFCAGSIRHSRQYISSGGLTHQS